MIQHEVSVHLDQPVEQVFSFLVDTSKLVSWQSNLIKSELLTEGPLHLGSQFREVRRLGQRESEIRGEIIAFEQGRYFETQTSTKPEVHVSYWLQPEDGGTRLRHQAGGAPPQVMWSESAPPAKLPRSGNATTPLQPTQAAIGSKAATKTSTP